MTLNEINFNRIIDFGLDNPDEYSFDDYYCNGCKHPDAKGYCVECEKLGIDKCIWDASFSLKNISHGSHTIDFLDSFNQKIDISGWNKAGVMFLMESPSKDYKIYKTKSIIINGEEYTKRPSVQWYWIHDKSDKCEYPKYFKGSEYGTFVSSAIVTFRLANAYLTNLVKCGLNDETGEKYKGIDDYNPECIDKCYELYLRKEIEIINPKVIFTFGSKVYNHLSNRLKDDSIKIVGLPHPAGRQRGFKNEYYNVLYFCMIAKWLRKTDVIDEEFYLELMKRFLETE